MFSIDDFNNYTVQCASRRGLLDVHCELKSIHENQFKRGIAYINNYFVNGEQLAVNERSSSIIRYFYFKSMENQISYKLFNGTGLWDVFYSPEEIEQPVYRTNLPCHLEEMINFQVNEINDFACDLLQYKNRVCNTAGDIKLFWKTVLLYIQIIGDIRAERMGLAAKKIGSYSNESMLTIREVREIAGSTLVSQLEASGYEISSFDFGFDPYYNIIAIIHDSTLFILTSAQISPTDPYFRPYELDKLYENSHQNAAIPYYASISVRSVDTSHYKDGVILRGDKTMVRTNAFGELEIEE
jgi:hypothetical protein